MDNFWDKICFPPRCDFFFHLALYAEAKAKNGGVCTQKIICETCLKLYGECPRKDQKNKEE